MANLKNTNIDDNLELPQGTTGQRPSSPQEGQIRYNTDLAVTEFYNGSNWRPLSDTHPEAEGGTVIDTTIGGVPYRIHYFTETGTDTLTVTNPGEVEVLIVGGGGAGGADGGGGGGAGGVIFKKTNLLEGSYTINVGDGAPAHSNGGNASSSQQGGNTSAFGSTALGGGGGGNWSGGSGANGGSGGGASKTSTPGQGQQSSSASGGFGNNGGTGASGGGGGGGGGSGQAGETNTSDESGGRGGIGLYFGNVFTNMFGEFGWFAAGGGGGNQDNGSPGQLGGIGGGGAGTRYDDTQAYSVNASKIANSSLYATGAGSGGSTGRGSAYGGRSSQGIVLVAYPLNQTNSVPADRTINCTKNQIITQELLVNIDLTSPVCYSGSGNAIVDIGQSFKEYSRNDALFQDKFGGYLSLNGVDNFISLDSVLTDLKYFEEGSIEFVLRATESGGIILMFSDPPNGSSSDRRRWLLNLRPESQNRYINTETNNGFARLETENFAYPINQWFHLVLTSNSDIYVNGRLLSVSFSPGDESTFWITDNPDRSTYSDASIGKFEYVQGNTSFSEIEVGQFRFYSIELSQAQVEQNFNAIRHFYGI